MTSILLGLGLLGAESLLCSRGATELEGAWSGARARSHPFDGVNLLEGLDVFDLNKMLKVLKEQPLEFMHKSMLMMVMVGCVEKVSARI